MTAKYIVLSNIISAVPDYILRICIQESFLMSKNLQFFFILYQHRTAYSSAIKFTRLISGNVCVQAEGMMKTMKTLVLIQHKHMSKESYNKIQLSYQVVSHYH